MHRVELQREADTYRHLPPHPRLLPMLGSNKDGDDPSIDLAYMPDGSLKAYLRRHSEMTTASLRVQWALQTAQGVAMLHSHSVIHADLKPANIVLDDALGVRIIDFAGCSLLGKAPYILETGAFYLPGDFRDEGIGCTVKSDLFALGSCIFQIVTGNKPHEGLEDKAIEDKFEEQVFPDLGDMMFAKVIRKCWFCEFECEFECADEVLLALSVEARDSLGDPDFPSSVLGESHR